MKESTLTTERRVSSLQTWRNLEQKGGTSAVQCRQPRCFSKRGEHLNSTLRSRIGNLAHDPLAQWGRGWSRSTHPLRSTSCPHHPPSPWPGVWKCCSSLPFAWTLVFPLLRCAATHEPHAGQPEKKTHNDSPVSHEVLWWDSFPGESPRKAPRSAPDSLPRRALPCSACPLVSKETGKQIREENPFHTKNHMDTHNVWVCVNDQARVCVCVLC